MGGMERDNAVDRKPKTVFACENRDEDEDEGKTCGVK